MTTRLTQERLARLLNHAVRLRSPQRHIKIGGVPGIATLEGPAWVALSGEAFDELMRLLPHLGEQEAVCHCAAAPFAHRHSKISSDEPSSAGSAAVPSLPVVSGPPDAQVTRVEVIDYRHGAPVVGRAFVAWGCAVELSRQDAGRTLKIFVMDRAAQAPQEESR